MKLVKIVTIYSDLDSGKFIAESVDPPVCSIGNTASIALLKLSCALQEANKDESPTNVVHLRKKFGS